MTSTSTQVNSAAAIDSVERICSYFPALQRTVGDNPVAYFDGPGGTQVPTPVGDAVADYLYNHNANTHWAYATSRETDAALEHARAIFATFLGADASEVAFGANMTSLAYHVSRALAPPLEVGDEVVVTQLDHHANVAPWTVLERERGVTIRRVRMVPATGQLDWDDFEQAVNERTKLVAIGAASNALGTINDVRRAVRLAQGVGALTFVDAVHFAPHCMVNVRELDCDFLACSAYKFYGPHVGVLYAKHDLLTSLDFPKLDPAPDGPPERAETGTLNHEGVVGGAAAVEWLAGLAGGDDLRSSLERVYQELDRRSAELFALLWEGLSAMDGVTLYGPPPGASRTPTLGFSMRGASPVDLARRLGTQGLFLSHGNFYALTVIEQLGLYPEGLLRAGLACYSTEEDVNRLIAFCRDAVG